MKVLYNEVLSEFYNGAMGIFQIDDFYIFKNNFEYGVAIENKYGVLIDESLANVHIKSYDLYIKGNVKKNLILLTTSLKSSRNEFASFCMHFIENGEDNTIREEISKNPLHWWDKWKELIGNKIGRIEPYDIIAELITLDNISKEEDEVLWSGPDNSSIDIQTSKSYYEVKSSIQRFENEITISSQFQLSKFVPNKNTYLMYFKFEKMDGGVTINNVVRSLEKNGRIDIGKIEDQLNNKGFKKNSSSRNISYVMHEVRKFVVDSNFPSLTEESFKDNKLPNNIKKISYIVSLEGIKSKKMDW